MITFAFILLILLGFFSIGSIVTALTDKYADSWTFALVMILLFAFSLFMFFAGRQFEQQEAIKAHAATYIQKIEVDGSVSNEFQYINSNINHNRK